MPSIGAIFRPEHARLRQFPFTTRPFKMISILGRKRIKRHADAPFRREARDDLRVRCAKIAP